MTSSVPSPGAPTPPDGGRVDAYDYLGAIEPYHPAAEAGLTVHTTDNELEGIKAELLVDPEPCPFDPDTLGPALVTWRDDLRFLAEEPSQ